MQTELLSPIHINGSYPILESGPCCAFSIHKYLKSSKNKIRPNVEYDVKKDSSGFAEIVVTWEHKSLVISH